MAYFPQQLSILVRSRTMYYKWSPSARRRDSRQHERTVVVCLDFVYTATIVVSRTHGFDHSQAVATLIVDHQFLLGEVASCIFCTFAQRTHKVVFHPTQHGRFVLLTETRAKERGTWVTRF